MPRSAVVIDREYLKHDPGQFHPERPARIKTLLDLAADLDSKSFELLPPRAALRAEIEACHTADYIEVVQATSVPIVSAGSIASYERIDEVWQAGAWGFTIGSAFFESHFVPNASFETNLLAVAEWLEQRRAIMD